MLPAMVRSRLFSLPAPPVWRNVGLACGAAVLLLALPVPGPKAQQAAATPAAEGASETPSPGTTAQAAPTPAPAAGEGPADRTAAAPVHGSAGRPAETVGVSEDQLRKLLEGKDLFLRGGYLDNTLAFNEHGVLIGHSPQGSYTLCSIRITKVRLMKHKVELAGTRYGLHFLGAGPDEDPTKAVDRVNITPKKKELRITIDRELVVKEKRQKSKEKSAASAAKPAAGAGNPAAGAAPPQAGPATAAPAPAASAGTPAADAEASDAEEAQAEIAAAPAAERPADAKSVTTTHSQAHANQMLEQALDNVFAQGFDTRMMAAMPAFWKLYYQSVTAKADYRPEDSNVVRQNTVDKKARLMTAFSPASNQFAQDYGVAGMSEYHVVVGADGKPQEIAVARPIGFGLDESAVEAIRKAAFEPAVKDGKPVAVLLDLVVQFRIYSQRTATASGAAPDQTPETPSLPGPYSVQH